MNATETAVTRHGNHVLITAPFLADLLRNALGQASETERRNEFEEFLDAQARADDAAERDACSYGPPQGCDETERLVGVADERWADLDLAPAGSLSLEAARRLYELLGTALLAEPGYVGRVIAARSAA